MTDDRVFRVYTEEFKFISKMIGPQAAVYRLANAYNVSVETMRTALRRGVVYIHLMDEREVPA